MSTRRDRQSSRSKPALEFSRQGQSTLDDDVRGFLSLRSGSQRHAREQERQVEVVEDDEVQEVKRVKLDPVSKVTDYLEVTSGNGECCELLKV